MGKINEEVQESCKHISYHPDQTVDLSRSGCTFGCTPLHPLGPSLQVVSIFLIQFNKLLKKPVQHPLRPVRVDYPTGHADRRDSARHLPSLLGGSSQRNPRPAL